MVSIRLSVDIGINNLAFCCCNSNKEILIWECLDTEKNIPSTLLVRKCGIITQKGNVCGCKGRYASKTGDVICLRHYKASTITKSDYTKIKPNKKKPKLLQEIANNVIECIELFVNRHTSVLEELDRVSIELQPRVNNKMKFVSHLVFGKFVECLNIKMGKNVKINFTSASYKLKRFKGPKALVGNTKKYTDRKKNSIECARWYLENLVLDNQSVWMDYFENQGKKDDLADTLLMCLNEF